MKKIEFGDDARIKIKQGVDILANAVKVTLGQKGQNVIILNKFGTPTITKDGVSVAQEVDVSDQMQNIGIMLAKEVANKTNDTVGDGTTTSTVLFQAIVSEGIKNLTAGANPISIKYGIEKAVEDIVAELKLQSISIDGDINKIKEVATIAANNDIFIGGLIADAISKVSKDGVITVEDSKGYETYLETVEGMQIERGYVSPHFITNHEKMTAELQDAYIFIYNGKIASVQEILPLLEKVANANKSILVIADDMEGDVFSAMIFNKVKGTIKICAIKSPEYGDMALETLKDISSVTRAKVFDQYADIKSVGLSELGFAKKIISSKEETTIIGGDSERMNIEERILSIKTQINDCDNKIEKKKHEKRLAKLLGGVAVLKIGGTTETEVKEKKDRVEDALQATKAAISEGIVTGGGIAYLIASEKVSPPQGFTQDQVTGYNIVKNAIQSPIKTIMKNAGVESSVIINEIKNSGFKLGYDTKTNSYVDMVENGIIDPVKVSRLALQNSASIAGLILTTNCIIVEEDDPKP